MDMQETTLTIKKGGGVCDLQNQFWIKPRSDLDPAGHLRIPNTIETRHLLVSQNVFVMRIDPRQKATPDTRARSAIQTSNTVDLARETLHPK